MQQTSRRSRRRRKPPEVLFTFPTTDEVTNYEEFIGHTDAVNTVEVRARVTGYLDKVNFNDGDEVEKGALLFQIDDRPYKAEYERALATLEQGKARLEPADRRTTTGPSTYEAATPSARRNST